jgi:hypothetical protein
MAMKALVVVGIAFIIAGVLAFAYQGFTYTTRETVAEVGPLKVTVAREHSLPSPMAVGGLALGAGIVLLIVGTKILRLSRGPAT